MIRLEVCVDSAEGVDAAVEGGADRLELCAALGVGGLTPSPGLMAYAAAKPIPTVAMIRSRPGDFVMSEQDLAIALGDISAAQTAGLAGVVIGANQPDGTLNKAALAAMVSAANGMEVVLHRSIDLTPDIGAAAEVIAELGIVRVLTSGGERRAIDGCKRIQQLIEVAAGRFTVMPGSGLTPENIGTLIENLEVSDVHSSCSARRETRETISAFGFADQSEAFTDRRRVAEMKTALYRWDSSQKSS